MSGLTHWTNLPKDIKPDFVSHSGDYDFPLYLSEKEEWVNFKNFKGSVSIHEPFLIMELNRLVPFFEDNCVKFHPLNMPNIKLGKIEIVGFVVTVKEDAKYYQYQVDDGTGSVTVYFERKFFDAQKLERRTIDEKYHKIARNMNIESLNNQECPKVFPNPRPQFSYPPDTSMHEMAIVEHNWFLETKHGLLGKNVERSKYVHAVGYCALDFMFGHRPENDFTFLDISTVKLYFLANKVICIDEWDYNAKLYSWLFTVVRKRYDEHPDRPEFPLEKKNVKVPI
ncbi:uncharacterized protein LOC128888447 [Hylaeus anthracinus]|uniref:uncharacterized protein LOC128888447 n=1 Tax=Hylaeus anthracinus TaxID=313031 RepID=UPI0023B8D459|nr:uncharacterized protein LOC128888447 [Hylaeus anthracinus]